MRQGIAVFDADLQLICSNRQFGDLLNVPPYFIQFGTPLREILEFMGVAILADLADREALIEQRLGPTPPIASPISSACRNGIW